MKLTKLFVGAFALSAMLVACGDDSASAKDTEIEEQSSSSAIEIASSSSTIRNDSLSSSAIESSSSSETTQSSSSTATTTLCSELPEGVCNYGTLTDSRDGQTYKTVTIGTQTWMADNLNYETENSYCYNDDPSNCSKYGRLYTWAAAMDSVGTWSTNGKGCGYNKTCSPTYPVRGVCPEGWHLPSTTEFETLFTAVGGVQDEDYAYRWNGAGTVLKSTSGWYDDGNGTDAFGFSALPAGGRYYGGGYDAEDLFATFWSSTEYDSDRAYSMYLDFYCDYAYLNYININKDLGRSVRCVKD